LAQEGAYAFRELGEDLPSVTYPSHTTIITGAYQQNRHYYNSPFEPEEK